MGSKNLHGEPFDQGTITKLEIFEDYAQAWIPTFVMQSYVTEIHIFDFFSGPGYDSNKVEGSPIRILQKIEEQLGNILSKGKKIVLHLNEYEPEKKTQAKYELLKLNCEEFVKEHPKFKYFLTVNFYNEDAEKLFFRLLPCIKKFPSLVYLDQNGIKFISAAYLNELDKVSTTDFLYFVSSSFFKRYGGTEEFKKVLTIDLKDLEKEEYSNMHRLVLRNMRTALPANSEVKLFPFSIRKNANIYGIVFGSKNYRAVDKFLGIAWNRNKLNGEADFDIDGDETKVQLDMFLGKKPTKIDKFKSELENQILTHRITNNKEALIYTYTNGHIPQHAVDVVKKLKEAGKLTYVGKTPAINYANVFKDQNIVNYTLK